MGRHLSQRAYARERGVTHRAVQKQLLAGHIHLEADGLIDVDRANAEWAAETNPARALFAAGLAPPGTPQGDADRPLEGHGWDAPASESGKPRPSERPKGGSALSLEAFSQARTLNETYKARTTRLAYERLEGSVVRSDDVRLAAFKAARHARDLLLAMPDRLAPLIAATTDPAEVHRLLVAEINRACDELKRPLIVRGPDGKPRSL
jgi:hypothetical protein